ncbi:C-C motif chemokine 4-like [Megalobrama amblycephala]|uniref:C-C motif chemokine 4-like n=1 Tax=Megalobrama amblycephala TaxID=75352 RepID=UPI002013CDDB|nr:C-C motif chemokine 4-like [Megalobrama amblycephala]XP_048019224.1 C-C motif chemokine 4-like [Megalobrama amblycephala]
MQLNQKMMKSLAAIAVIMSVMIMETNGEESPFGCCTSVSTKKITVPITGFRYQKQNLPCVTAVIFNTTKGEMCVHGGIKWVREKVKELMKLQRQQKMNSTVILSP